MWITFALFIIKKRCEIENFSCNFVLEHVNLQTVKGAYL